MPRSSRHKSSKHSSRDAKEYSDSEKDSSLKDRKAKEEDTSRVSKDSGSSEKRKLDSKDAKDLFGSGNGEYSESKRRKEKIDDGGSDRWNGGDDNRGEGSRKAKDLKSRRIEDGDGEEAKKGSGKSEGRHKDSNRKEGREGGVERERKGKEGKSEKLVADNGGERTEKKPGENTELYPQDGLQNPEPENQLERRIRKRRDGSGDEDKHHDDIGDINGRRLSSRDDIANVKDGRQKDEKHKDDKYRDKYREDVDKDNKNREEKKRDERLARDRTSNRSDDKHLRDGKDTMEIRQKKSKLQDGDRDHDREHDQDQNLDPGRSRDRDRHRERERDHDRDRERDHEHDRNRDRYRDRDRGRDRDRSWDRDRDRDRDQERDRFRDRDREHDRDLDYDGPNIDERSARYKDYTDANARGLKAHHLAMERKYMSGNRVESDADRGRSQSRQAHLDTAMSNKRRTSPSSSSHVDLDEYRHVKQGDFKHRDYATEQRPNATSSKEVTNFSGVTERVSKYRSMEKQVKMDDGHMGELSAERSSSSKASPMGLVERSPSSTSVERKYMNRTGAWRKLDVEETGRRSSASFDVRDFSATDDRPSRELPLDKLLVDESSQADSSFYNRTSQGNSSSFIPPPPGYRAGVGSPSFLGSLEEDSRANPNARHKRNGDPNVGRGPGNAWRGVPNWSPLVPNGFIPYQHGPPHGGFPAMMQQFPSPLFGVRPSMEINHSGIPYHIPDADRFSSHLRPLGWQNMMDGSGPSHMHGWDGNNGVFRDEPHMYGGPDWDQNRRPVNGRGWETSADMWKGQNGDGNMDFPLAAQKDHPVQAQIDNVLSEQAAGQRSQHENNHHEVWARSVETRPSVTSPGKETSESPPKATLGKTSEPSKISTNDGASTFFHVYLSKLDISTELTHSELYNQCMSSLDMEHSAPADEDTSMQVILNVGARAGPKSSNALLSRPLFPAVNDSVFQKAMDLYKQSIETRGMPITSGRILKMISASNQDMEEQVPVCNQEKSKEPAPTTVDQKRGEEVAVTAAAEEKLEEQVSNPPEVPVQAVSGENSEEPKPAFTVMKVDGMDTEEVPVQALSQEKEEPVPAAFTMMNVDEMTSEQVNLHDADKTILLSPKNPSNTATTLPTNGGNWNGVSMVEGSESACFAGNRQAVDDAINQPLVYSDGSLEPSEALMMAGSNESESVILSRIHHSPESTH